MHSEVEFVLRFRPSNFLGWHNHICDYVGTHATLGVGGVGCRQCDVSSSSLDHARLRQLEIAQAKQSGVQ